MERAPEKPKFGEPCNGCGFCCAAELCPLAIEFIGDGDGPRPALEFNQGRFLCGLLTNASRYSNKIPPMIDAAVAAILSPLFGSGCDSGDNNHPQGE